jgi:hypothetical protein
MQVIPALDLLGHEAVRLEQGDYQRVLFRQPLEGFLERLVANAVESPRREFPCRSREAYGRSTRASRPFARVRPASSSARHCGPMTTRWVYFPKRSAIS